MGNPQFSNTGPLYNPHASQDSALSHHPHQSRACSLSNQPHTCLTPLTRPTVEMSDTAAASVEINDALFCQAHLKEIVRASSSCVGLR